MSVRLFPGETNIWICGLRKAVCPSQHTWTSNNPSRTEQNQNVEEGKTESFLPDWMNWDIDHLLSSALQFLRSSDPDWNLHRWFSWSSGHCQTELGHQLFWVSSLQTPVWETSQPPQLRETIPFNKSLPVYISYCFHVSRECWIIHQGRK